MADDNYEDEWETSSGLALDGAIATVTDMQFGFNNQIGPGVVCANFSLTTEDGEELDQSFSVGGTNEASRDGTILEGSGKISKNSNFGLLIESIKDVVDNPAETIGRVRDVSGWIGTKWQWGTINLETTNPNTGETKSKSKFIVTDYLGRDDGAKAEPKKAAKKSTGKAKAKKDTPPAADDGDEGGLWATLVELAQSYDDHDEFVDAALDIDGVADDRDLQRAVMKTTEGSVWAAAGKEA